MQVYVTQILRPLSRAVDAALDRWHEEQQQARKAGS